MTDRPVRPISDAPWTISIDTGGTFTDCIARSPQGVHRRIKVLSNGRLRAILRRDGTTHRLEWRGSRPELDLTGARLRMLIAEGEVASEILSHDAASDEVRLRPAAWLDAIADPRIVELDLGIGAPRLAIALAIGCDPRRILAAVDLRIATTRGTNALLEHRVGRTLLLVTEGFADLLRIGDQTRPDLFALAIPDRVPLHAAVVEVPSRLDALGSLVRPLDEDLLRRRLGAVARDEIDAVALSLVHGARHPATEARIAELLRAQGFRRISCGSTLSSRPGYLERTTAATANAALDREIRDFLAEISRPGERISVRVMTSAGALVERSRFEPIESLLSGPAAGAVGVAAVADSLGRSKVIGFDMGGTSTDVVRVAGRVPVRGRTVVGHLTLASACVGIETVAAGGGSICSVDAEGRLRVGPESAGADPGPACYGRGGPLTITDVNLLLGRVDPRRFGVPLDVRAAERVLERILTSRGGSRDRLEVLESFRAIADERMAGAIESVSSRLGFAPSDHSLVAFGGAGGQHATAIADRLGIAEVILPLDAGLLSAAGLSHARLERRREQSILEPLERFTSRAESVASGLLDRASEDLLAQGLSSDRIERGEPVAALRLAGQEEPIELPLFPIDLLAERFRDAFRGQYGYLPPARPIEVMLLHATCRERLEQPPRAVAVPDLEPPTADATIRLRSRGRWVEAPSFDRARLEPGAAIAGPAVISDPQSTAILDEGWTARVESDGAVVARRCGERDGPLLHAAGRPEILAARLASIAEEMGERLRRTAISVNIKHRLDFSCAILDGAGTLVVNAPHLPVHLGALGLAARTMLARLPLRRGDVAVTNHPAFGGSHLPDVTVITPIFLDEEPGDGTDRPIAILANRAHHAEIGGVRPGSMAPSATRLVDEGVAIAPRLLVSGGEARWSELEAILRGAPFPSRAVEENLADLAAQVAANQRGAERLRTLIAEAGPEAFLGSLAELATHGLATLRRAIPRLLPSPTQARVELDDGTPIAVSLSREARREGEWLVVDFAGSGGVHPSNRNAPRAIVHAAVLYVLRVLLGEDLPLHEGLMRAVDLRVPPGILDPPFVGDPREDPAVAAGNTETSQRIVECLMLAFGAVAGGQGTMNNVILGSDAFGSYETIGGGAGAGDGFRGASAVHTHMTNTRIGDPEFIEARHPIRIEEFSIRRGTGGRGRFAGGDGVRRVYRAIAPLSACVVAEHRREGGPGLSGGEPGAPGAERVLRHDGRVEAISGHAEVDLEPGDRLVVETPGGGGFGAHSPPSAAATSTSRA